jgi:F-type H+-transporting ATPase subunit epsilon
MATTQVELVTPSRTLFSGEAEMVVCRTAGGDIAFLANHMAYLGALQPCLLRVVHPQETLLGTRGSQLGDEVRFAVHGGFVEVRDNRVVVLCDVAEPAGEIDTQRAERARAGAESRLSADRSDDEAQAALRRAEVRLEVARPGGAGASHQ